MRLFLLPISQALRGGESSADHPHWQALGDPDTKSARAHHDVACPTHAGPRQSPLRRLVAGQTWRRCSVLARPKPARACVRACLGWIGARGVYFTCSSLPARSYPARRNNACVRYACAHLELSARLRRRPRQIRRSLNLIFPQRPAASAPGRSGSHPQ